MVKAVYLCRLTVCFIKRLNIHLFMVSYGKAFGKALFGVAVAPLFSGIVGLLGDSEVIAIIAVAVLMIGIGIGIGFIVAVQKKYNKGIF